MTLTEPMGGCDEVACKSVTTALGTEQAQTASTLLLFIVCVFACMMMMMTVIRKLTVLRSNS